MSYLTGTGNTRAVVLLSVEDRPFPDQIIGQPPLKQLAGEVIPACPAKRANRDEVLIGHGFHRGRDIAPALLAADHVIPDPFLGRLKHEKSLGEQKANIYSFG